MTDTQQKSVVEDAGRTDPAPEAINRRGQGSFPARRSFLSLRQARGRFLIALALSCFTLANGLLGILSVIGSPTHPRILREIFPLEFIGFSRTSTLLIGFALVISSLNVLRRKRRAWGVVVALACGSVIFHLTKGLDYEEAA